MTKTLRCDFNFLEMDFSKGGPQKSGSESCQLQEVSVNAKMEHRLRCS